MKRKIACSVLAAGLLVQTAQRARGYALEGQTWPAGAIVMNLRLGTVGGINLDGSTSWDTVAEGATVRWNSVMTNVHLYYNTTVSTIAQRDGNNTMYWADNVFGSSLGSSTLAITTRYYSGTRITEADITFNTNKAWNSYRGPLQNGSSGGLLQDFYRVALHELGHVLGLDHPDQQGQSVVAQMNSMESNLDDLAPDDIRGIQSLYGAPRPAITFLAPANGTRTHTEGVTATVRVTKARDISDVQFNLNNPNTNGFHSGNKNSDGTWSANLSLAVGPNRIRAVAYDVVGNVSTTAVISVTYALVQTLNLQISGDGRVTGVANQQQLELGTVYTATAIPGSSSLFTGWTGDIVSPNTQLTFTMRTGLSLVANFIPNPFISAQGSYRGLFFEGASNGVTHQSSGFFVQTLTSQGSFSARIKCAGQTNVFSGKFSPYGAYATTIVREGGLRSLIANLQMNFGNPNSMSGTISDGRWTAHLTAYVTGSFSANNPSPYTGKYTLVIPGGNDSSTEPAGDSFGAITVAPSGSVAFSGWRADGTPPITLAGAVCENGFWPFYLPLYAGKGSMLGWLAFASSPYRGISGNVSWIKLANPGMIYYPLGFTNQTAVLGSSYVFTPGVPIMNISTGRVAFTQGNPPANFTNQVAMVNNTVINLSPNWLSLIIANSSGLFSGSATNPADGRKISFKGALLQNQNVGRGMVLETNESGAVLFEAVP